MRKISKSKFLIAIIIILTIISVLLIIFPTKKLVSDSYESYNKSTIGKIKKDDVITQEFVSDKNYNGIGISFATYSEILNNGNILIKIYEEEKIIKEAKIKASSIKDNSSYYFDCKLKENYKYKLKITAENINQSITIYTTGAKVNNANLIINNLKSNDNILLQFTYQKANYFNIWYCILGISLTLLFLIYVKSEEG